MTPAAAQRWECFDFAVFKSNQHLGLLYFPVVLASALSKTSCEALSDAIVAIMMTGADIAQLKAYVQAAPSGIQNRDAATVLLQVSHSNLAARFMEIRVDLHVSRHMPGAENTAPLVRWATCHTAAGDQDAFCLGFTSFRTQAVMCACLQTTVDALKTKLMTHTGTSPSAMQLQLKDERGRLLADLDPARPLGFYSPQDQ